MKTRSRKRHKSAIVKVEPQGRSEEQLEEEREEGEPEGKEMLRLCKDGVRLARLESAGLCSLDFASQRQVARLLFGTQAQDANAGYYSGWVRLKNRKSISLNQLRDEAVKEQHNVVRLWGQRGTLHLYDWQDWPVVASATGLKLVKQREQKCAQAGLGDVLDTELSRAKEILNRGEVHLSEHFESQSTLIRHATFMISTLTGVACRVDTGKRTELVSREKVVPNLVWTGPPVEEATILAAKRYFQAYGPATEEDFRYWLGTTAGLSKSAVESLIASSELVSVLVDVAQERSEKPSGKRKKVNESTMLWTPDRANEFSSKKLSSIPAPTLLLGRFEPVLLAHKDKSWVVEDCHKPKVWKHSSEITNTVMVDGKVVGIWSKTNGEKLDVNVEWLEKSYEPSKQVLRLLNQQAKDVATFYGKPFGSLQFL